MPGVIDNSTDDALWSSYNGGRVNVGKQSTKVSNLAQWSALLDSKTCDFCSWADERIFDTSIEPYDPPMHFGCRCLIALILKSELPPDPTWGKGPPDNAFPPGKVTKTPTTPVFEEKTRTKLSESAINNLLMETEDWPADAKGIANQALFEQEGVIVTARAEQNKLVGIMHYRDLSNITFENILEVTNVASSGNIRGTGKALMTKAAKKASISNLTMQLHGIDPARGFYIKLGMRETRRGIFEWSSEEAAQFVRSAPL